jgi:hypothetical protein
MKALRHGVASAMLVAACVSDDNAGSSGNTKPVDAGAIEGSIIAADAAPVCSSEQKACAGSCVDLRTSADHCGACGKTCGGGACTNSECGPGVVRADIPELGGYALEAGKIYFTSGKTIKSCAADSCKSDPTQLGAMSEYPVRGIEVDRGFVYFESAPDDPANQRQAIFRCPVAGCSNPPGFIYSAGRLGVEGFGAFNGFVFVNVAGVITSLDCSGPTCRTASTQVPRLAQEFAVDNENLYFRDLTSGANTLNSCLRSQTPCTDRTLLASAVVTGDIVVAQEQVLFLGEGAVVGGKGVYACPKEKCMSPTPLTKLSSEITSLTADDAGIYWAAEDKIVVCPDAKCIGGPKALVGITGVPKIRLTPQFVYYTVPGAVAGSTTIMRIAR